MNHILPYRKAVSRVALAYCVGLILTQLGQAGLGLLCDAFAPDLLETQGAAMWLLTQIPMYCLCLPAVLLLLRTVPNGVAAPSKNAFGLRNFFRMLAMLVAVMILGNMVSLIITALIGLLKASGTVTNPVLSMVEGSSLWATFLIGAVLVPIGEEVLFRLLPYRKLATYGTKPYVFITALIFSCAHGNLSQMVYAFFIGALLAYVYAQTGKVWLCMVYHIIINTYGMVASTLALEHAVAMGVLLVVIYTLTVLGIIYLVQGRHKAQYTEAVVPMPVREMMMHETFFNVGMAFLLAFTACMVAVVTVMM